MALSLPTNHSSPQSPLRNDMSVTTGEEKKKQKATDTSKPLKNLMVFVEDLASGMCSEGVSFMFQAWQILWGDGEY